MDETGTSLGVLLMLEPHGPGDVLVSQHTDTPHMHPFLTFLSEFFGSPLKNKLYPYC